MVPLIGIAVPLVRMTVVTGCEFGKKSQHPPDGVVKLEPLILLRLFL
jgi:hypothetical protein